jgi:hypothetical protein
MVKYTESEKQAMLNHVEQHKVSGMSIRLYCEHHGIKEHVFHYWRTGKQRNEGKSEGKFISLPMSNPTMLMEVVFPSGASIRFSNYAPVDYIKSLCYI